ncbi:reverse transcriptase [Lasius niger]|uniref:Reverse transcriptase n=1 Tax=Lasius niger TaxID=67767 RepID=A0A0J7JZ01_LASNI|nr:reverse transcriptase [Lasius niger]
MLDSVMTFREHFEYMESKASKVMNALGRLMPNLRGPDEKKRQLYANVLASVLLYGAPIWSDALASSKRTQVPFRRIQRGMALRVISAYRSVSFNMATISKNPATLPNSDYKREDISQSVRFEESRHMDEGSREEY